MDGYKDGYEVEGQTRIIADYAVAVECENPKTFYTCYKCGACGRRFNADGFMISNGGTTIEDESE